MPLLPYNNIIPKIAENVFIAPNSYVIGNVEIGPEVGVWFNCTIRGDVNYIKIGARTNIQDGTIIHVWRHSGPTNIGANVTIGHKALLHACTIEDNAFIGMGAVILDYAKIETGAMVAAGAVVPPYKIVPAGQIWAGNPAKYLRDLKQEEIDFIPKSADNYVKHVYEYNEIMKTEK